MFNSLSFMLLSRICHCEPHQDQIPFGSPFSSDVFQKVLWLSQSVRISSPKKLPYIFMISFVRRSHSSSVNSSFNTRYSTIAGLQITLCAISSPTIFCPLHSSQRCQSTCLCVFAQLRQRISRCMVTGSQIRTTACSLVAVRSQRKGTKVYTPFWFSKFG